MTKLGVFKNWDSNHYKNFFKEGVPFEIIGKVYFLREQNYSYLVKKTKGHPNDTTFANVLFVVEKENYEFESYTGHSLRDYMGVRTLLFIRESQVMLIKPKNKDNKNILDKGDF